MKRVAQSVQQWVTAIAAIKDTSAKGIGSVFVASLLLLLGGCSGGMQVTHIKSSQQKPNNVWIFFTVEKREEPVAGLSADDFKIYEDGELVSNYESKQVILNPEVAAVMYTLLLLDMSGSVTESGQADSLVDAAKMFSERVGKHQKVGVYAFDGEAKLHSVVPFTEQQGSVEGGLEGLRTYKPKDPSTNMHGAVVQAMGELKKALDKEKKPLRFGTLVVFSDGTDRAARVSREEMNKEMQKDEYKAFERFAIGVGGELQKSSLSDVGRDGTELASDQGKVREAFDRVASRIERHMLRFYLLSYCTPSRNGRHRVRVEAHKDGSVGRLEYEFNADGFGPPPECDPERKPDFKLDTDSPPHRS